MQTTSIGSAINTLMGNNSAFWRIYSSAADWDESNNLTFTRAYSATGGYTLTTSEIKLIKGGTVAVPTNAVPLACRVSGGTVESTNSYGVAQTTLNISIPPSAGYGVFHIQDVMSGTKGGSAKEIQDIILVKFIKY